MKLTEELIDRIIGELHSAIQFYDENGKPANGKVLNKIQFVLENIDGMERST